MKTYKKVLIPTSVSGGKSEIFVCLNDIADGTFVCIKSNSAVNGEIFRAFDNAKVFWKGQRYEDLYEILREEKSLYDSYRDRYKLRRPFVTYILKREGFDLTLVMIRRYERGRRGYAKAVFTRHSIKYLTHFEEKTAFTVNDE